MTLVSQFQLEVVFQLLNTQHTHHIWDGLITKYTNRIIGAEADAAAVATAVPPRRGARGAAARCGGIQLPARRHAAARLRDHA